MVSIAVRSYFSIQLIQAAAFLSPKSGSVDSLPAPARLDDDLAIGRREMMPTRLICSYMLMFSITLVTMCPTSYADDKTAVPIPGKQIIIRVANVVGTVDVRAKSLGPGLCGVKFEAGADTASFLAPPIEFSKWVPLTNHLGEATIKVTVEEVCDTGVLPEVRYFKK